MERSPIEKVKNAKVQKEPPDPFSLDEANLIIDDLRKHAGEAVGDYFEFAFFTGVRASEQIALEWKDYDRKRGLLRVARARVWGKNKNKTKTNKTRDLELLQRAIDVLQRQRARTELAGGAIFHNVTTNMPWADEQVQRRYFDAAVKRLGLRHRPPKQTRHTFATGPARWPAAIPHGLHVSSGTRPRRCCSRFTRVGSRVPTKDWSVARSKRG